VTRAVNIDPRDRLRAEIGTLLDVEPDRVTLFARGRVALYAILRALGVGPGDEVILPAFTCVAVPNAILYARARPVWVDIDPETLCLDPAAVDAAISPRTRVILAQNTFGLSADLDAIMAIAARHGVTVLDDCAHGLGGRYRGRPNGATAPFSFFSMQWSKPISTGLGGIAVDRDGAVASELRALEAAALEPSGLRAAAVRILLYGREHVGGGRLFRAGRAAYRALGRSGVLPGSSSHDELEGTAMPRGFLTRLSASQARLGSERLGGLPAATERRQSTAHRYSELLAAAGRTVAAEPANAEHGFLRYPLRVADRPSFVAAAERSGVDLGEWFISPVHPVVDALDRWGYEPGQTPTADRACREIVNLPTDPSLSDGDVDRVRSFLSANLDLIA
jgi:perosamine synthetase